MRGVRMQLHWHENPLYRFAAAPDLGADPTVQRNVGAARRLRLELRSAGVRAADGRRGRPRRGLPERDLRAAARRHAGGPVASGARQWRAGMVRLAACPNVVSKLSGLGTFLHRNDPAHIAEVVRETVSMFGADRCLFGSNFPIEKLWTSYGALIGAFREAAEAAPPENNAQFCMTRR